MSNEATKRCLSAAARIPEGSAYFVASSNPLIRSGLEKARQKADSLISKMIAALTEKEESSGSWREVEDALDKVFATIDDSISNLNNLTKRPKLEITEAPVDLNEDPLDQGTLTGQSVDNSNSEFISKLKVKPHAIVPLEETPSNSHIYESEIRNWLSRETSRVSEISQLPIAIMPVKNTELEYIDSVSGLDSLIADLSQQDIIAVDLEHHSMHSYRGFTCLVQISTKSKDYILDPFPVWREMYKLNAVFCDPEIVKVFHGGDSDILWLQRDFGIYVVNMFDTGQAARILQVPGGRGLANLLSFYCDIKADKQYQMADWRERPLSREMLKYAREDTHYLIYIYQRMVRVLLTQGAIGDFETATAYGRKMLQSVVEASTQIALKTHREELHDPYAHASNLCLKTGNKLEGIAFATLSGILSWRDRTARQLNKSTGYIFPDRACIRLASQCPSNPSQIERLCLSAFVSQNSQEVWKSISEIIASEKPGNIDSVSSDRVDVETEFTAFEIAKQPIKLVHVGIAPESKSRFAEMVAKVSSEPTIPLDNILDTIDRELSGV